MREILFRGKRVDNGEWVYGAFCPDLLEIEDGREVDWGFIRTYNKITDKMEMIAVDRKTVGQDTNLKDKNGNKIFEGDKIKGFTKNDYFKQKIRAGYIFFCERFGGWYVQDFIEENAKLCLAQMQDIEIIGNIHDNKDLIGEQNGNRC